MASSINQSIPVAGTPATAAPIQSNFAIAAQEITDLQNQWAAGGAQGAQGAAGPQGAQGSQGGVGAQGAQGAPGTGVQGAQGAQGAAGADGTGGAASAIVADVNTYPVGAHPQGTLLIDENTAGIFVRLGSLWIPAQVG